MPRPGRKSGEKVQRVCAKSRRTDLLPPSVDASAYRPRASRAALPLCEGENKAAHFAGTFSPSVRGRRERSERGGQLCRVVVQSLPWASPISTPVQRGL